MRLDQIISGEVLCAPKLSLISDLPGNSPSIHIQVLLLGVELVKWCDLTEKAMGQKANYATVLELVARWVSILQKC